MQKFKDEKATYAATQPRDVQTACLLREKSQLCCDELLAYLALLAVHNVIVNAPVLFPVCKLHTSNLQPVVFNRVSYHQCLREVPQAQARY